MSADAIDRLRRKAQNEATVFALSDLLRVAESERDNLRAELAKARELLADVRDNHKYAIHWEDLHPVMARVREWLERNP